MENKFIPVMSKKTDAELIKIVYDLRNDYQPEAVIAAEFELNNRNIEQTRFEEAVKENHAKKQIETEKANKPLEEHWKVLTFLFPGVIQMFIAGSFKIEGYDKKASELTKWTFYGFGFYFGLITLLVISVNLLK